MKRPATSTGRLPAAPATMPPAETMTSAPSIARRRCRPSPRRPRTGAERAPAISAAVSDHWALGSEIRRSAATSGRSGAPRLLMIETTSVMPTSTGTKAAPAAVESDGRSRLGRVIDEGIFI